MLVYYVDKGNKQRKYLQINVGGDYVKNARYYPKSYSGLMFHRAVGSFTLISFKYFTSFFLRMTSIVSGTVNLRFQNSLF